MLRFLQILTILMGLAYAHAQEGKASCSEETPNACYESGVDSLKKNQIDEGTKLLVRACEYKMSRACLKLGSLNEKMRNFAKAKEYYLKTCEIEDTKKCPNAERLK